MIAVSFYNKNINPEIVEYQKKVFDHFGIDIIQFEYNVEHKHGFAVDWWLTNRWKDYGYQNIAIFDIDCIPLHRSVLHEAHDKVEQGFLYGAVQRANHIPQSQVYCSPAFCCFSKEAYDRAGQPTFTETTWHDVGSFFTNELIRVGHIARLIWPIHVENPVWDLTRNCKFGHGTNYDGMVYHAFESRLNGESTNRFIEKCKQILGDYVSN